jgi:hypothetical protein
MVGRRTRYRTVACSPASRGAGLERVGGIPSGQCFCALVHRSDDHEAELYGLKVAPHRHVSCGEGHSVPT